MALTLVISLGKPLTRPENGWLDGEMRLLSRHLPVKPDSPVIVVGIDDASLQEFAVPLATIHQQIGAFFEAMAQAKPRAVGVDVVLPQVSFDRIKPGLDLALARGIVAIKPVAPLVLGVTATAEGTLRPLHPLFANLAGPEGVALVFIPRDDDGTIRRYVANLAEGTQALTLAGQVAKRLGIPLREGLIPFFRIAKFSYVPLKDVLALRDAGRTDDLRALFEGKVVFLGSLLAHDDQHHVPISLSKHDMGDTTHGVFLHAAHMHSLMTDGFIQNSPIALNVLIALLLAMTWWVPPGFRAWVTLTASLSALAILSLTLLALGWAIPAVTWGVALTLGIGGRTVLTAWQSAAERRRLRQAFDGYVSPGVLSEILQGRLTPQLAGERREVCVLFSDIRNFTAMSENAQPEHITNLLNSYFERMTASIHRNNGTLDKFIGDGIMAFFGAPQASENSCADAFCSAREMLTEVEAFNRERVAMGDAPIAIGIGLHYGSALIGYVGGKSRHEFSAIGDTVNTASRLEGLTKDFGYPIVISDTVRQRLSADANLTDLGEHPIRGRRPIRIYGWKPQ